MIPIPGEPTADVGFVTKAQDPDWLKAAEEEGAHWIV